MALSNYRWQYILTAIPFIATLCFTHLPFFIYIPIPLISPDSFTYHWAAYQIHSGNLPLQAPIDLPLGYPLFLFLLKKAGFNLLGIVAMQAIIYGLAGMFLIYTFFSYKKSWGIAATIALCLYTIQPFTIRYNLSIATESLYTSTLFVFVGALLLYEKSKSIKTFSLTALSVLLALTFRSNGIIFLIFPLAIIGYSIFKKEQYIPYLLCFFFLVITPQLILNYSIKDKIAFSETERMAKVFKWFQVVNSKDTGVKDNETLKIRRIANPRSDMYKKYFSNFFTSKPSFYYSTLKTEYHEDVVKEITTNKTIWIFEPENIIETFSPGLRAYVFEGFDYSAFQGLQYESLLDINAPKNLWIYSVHLFYQIMDKTNFLFLVYMFFIISFAKLIINSIKSQQPNFFKWSLIYIHLFTLIILPLIHIRFQGRYIHVSEFIVFLLPLLYIFDYPIIRKIKIRLSYYLKTTQDVS